ncbi:MAG: hypothetical protein ABIJ11_08090 [Elusimicrobiota bacterium]
MGRTCLVVQGAGKYVYSMKIKPEDKCILMFSGGRDSTISAVCLSGTFKHLTLVTVLSEHLVGIERVYERVIQLKKHLPKGTEWLQVIQPKIPVIKILKYATCLPCQHAYIIIGVMIAKRLQISNLALGYAGYQNSWPEQTPYSTRQLKKLLKNFGINLRLPAYDTKKKEDAISKLIQLGLESESYEQKCLRQSSNVELKGDILKSEIDRWINCIDKTIKSIDNVQINTWLRVKIEDVMDTNLLKNTGGVRTGEAVDRIITGGVMW